MPGIFFKPYPANHFTHAAVDAGLALRERGVRARATSRASSSRVPSAVIRTIGEPIEVKRAPETGYQAQFSGPYAVVAGLLGGGGLGVGLADYTDELAPTRARRALMALVDVVGRRALRRDLPAPVPRRRHRHDHRRARPSTEEVLANRGGPHRPLSDDELATKFRDERRRAACPTTSPTACAADAAPGRPAPTRRRPC